MIRTDALPATTLVTVETALWDLIKSRNGWSRFRLPLFDLSPRWRWWMLARTTGRVPSYPLPQIQLETHLTDSAQPMRMLAACLKMEGARFEDFLTWLLYGFGAHDVHSEPRVASSKLLGHWEQTFDLELLLDQPGDWLGHLYETHVASRSLKAATGFFSTPMALCELMVQLARPGLFDTVHEPCCGSGRMLMAASNYSVRLSGVDVNPVLCRIAILNGWLYMPSLIMPMAGLDS